MNTSPDVVIVMNHPGRGVIIMRKFILWQCSISLIFTLLLVSMFVQVTEAEKPLKFERALPEVAAGAERQGCHEERFGGEGKN